MHRIPQNPIQYIRYTSVSKIFKKPWLKCIHSLCFLANIQQTKAFEIVMLD